MKKDTFTQGVSPGGLKEKQEIKILICFILDKLAKPLKKGDVTSILQNYGLANYFEASQAFAEMAASNNICLDEENEGCYVITESGKIIVEELSGILPVTVKEKALKSAEIYLERVKNEQENKVSITKNSNGYNVKCSISDGEFNMLELTLYAPDMNSASIIRDNFYKNPSEIYYTVISLLTRDD